MTTRTGSPSRYGAVANRPASAFLPEFIRENIEAFGVAGHDFSDDDSYAGFVATQHPPNKTSGGNPDLFSSMRGLIPAMRRSSAGERVLWPMIVPQPSLRRTPRVPTCQNYREDPSNRQPFVSHSQEYPGSEIYYFGPLDELPVYQKPFTLLRGRCRPIDDAFREKDESDLETSTNEPATPRFYNPVTVPSPGVALRPINPGSAFEEELSLRSP